MKSLLNLSEASNLAIHALAYMATLGPNQPVSASRIAADISVSESHLSKVLQNLARENFIQSTRGKRGGFYFERDPKDITLLQILLAVDGPFAGEQCLLGEPVCQKGHCRLQGLMKRVTDLVTRELGEIHLSELLLLPALDIRSQRQLPLQS